MTPLLKNWSITETFTIYGVKHHLHGDVYDHPDFRDGAFIDTSSIQKVEGESFITRTRGYQLSGPANSFWTTRLADNNRTPQDVVRIVREKYVR